VTFYAALALDRHVVVACDDRWTYVEQSGDRRQHRPKIWRVNDRTVGTGSGLMHFVEAWAKQHFPKNLPGRVDVPALDRSLPEFRRAIVADHARLVHATQGQGADCSVTLLLAGVGRDGSPFLLSTNSVGGFEPRLARKPGACFRLPLALEHDRHVRSEVFFRDLGARLLALPAACQVAEVARALPDLVRRVAEVDDGVAPTGHIAVVGPEGTRMDAF
jgi:hypothetical protein